jgi:hypothetical protein
VFFIHDLDPVQRKLSLRLSSLLFLHFVSVDSNGLLRWMLTWIGISLRSVHSIRAMMNNPVFNGLDPSGLDRTETCSMKIVD